MKSIKIIMFSVVVALLALFAYASAQDFSDGIPSFYELVFSSAMLAAIGAITTFTKYVRNMLGGIKGWLALAITFLVSMAYAFIQYGSVGIEFAIGAGVFAFVASAGLFKVTKLIGSLTVKAVPQVKLFQK
jgi:hypothetical protein